MHTEYLIIGSGLTGAVIARTLHDAGCKVLIVERRHHVGGNVHDHWHPSGIRIHTYGPHYFRTSSDRIWDFVRRFSNFYPYEAALQTEVDGRHENWPIAASYIQRAIGTSWKPEFTGAPTNFEEASLAMMPRMIYEKFVKGYSEKQWGVPASKLSATLAGRFDVRLDDEPRLKLHRYQGIPTDGYAVFMERMVRGIPVLLNTDFRTVRAALTPAMMTIYTGPIDEYFDHEFGKLHYRGQQRAHTYYPDKEFVQPCGQVNNPGDAGPHIRTLEWKHMMPNEYRARIRGTVLTTEVTVTPSDPNEYEYPFPDSANQTLYRRYRDRAGKEPRLLICGRLGEYRYFDMDQAIARAQMLADRIIAARQIANAVDQTALAKQAIAEIADVIVADTPAPESAAPQQTAQNAIRTA